MKRKLFGVGCIMAVLGGCCLDGQYYVAASVVVLVGLAFMAYGGIAWVDYSERH